MTFSATDHAMMAHALRLAARGAYTTRPNPMVGCVIARGDTLVGQGWHQRKGGPHAEVLALEAAGETVFTVGRVEAGPRGCTVSGSAETWWARSDWTATHNV